jgi:hypothetical protein
MDGNMKDFKNTVWTTVKQETLIFIINFKKEKHSLIGKDCIKIGYAKSEDKSID